MTDGQATVGSDNIIHLKSLVDQDIFNYFIGFGTDHNSKLLGGLGTLKNSNYYFIDSLENAGLVYGEILHNILYESFNNLTIKIKNGFIYNWQSNTWGNEFFLTSIPSESHKIFHIISKEPINCDISISGNMNGSENLFILKLDVCTFCFNENLDKYIFRQRTMELLYEVKNFKDDNSNDLLNPTGKDDNDESQKSPVFTVDLFAPDRRNQNVKSKKSKNLINKLKKFMSELKEYIRNNHLQQDIFMTNLCDDIYISYKTFYTEYRDMYVSARQVSQGSQRSYNVTQVPNYITTPFNSSTTLDQQAIFEIDDVPSPPKINLTARNLFSNDLNSSEQDVDIDIDMNISHIVSANITSPYATPHVLKVMNHISSDHGHRVPLDFFEDKSLDLDNDDDDDYDEMVSSFLTNLSISNILKNDEGKSDSDGISNNLYDET